jgi:hypothetical protein
MANEISPFDFIGSVTHNKKDLIRGEDVDNTDENEKQYAPFIVNRGLALFADTILHANEMNLHHQLPKDAQYRYYLAAIRPNKRYAKWPKLGKDKDLDLIQEMLSCNRTVAKQYAKVLSPDQLKAMHASRETGGT